LEEKEEDEDKRKKKKKKARLKEEEYEMMKGITFCLRCSLYIFCGSKESGRMVSRNHIRILLMLFLKMQEAGTTTEFSTLKILSLT